MPEATQNSVQHFIARQPIFDRRQQVMGYELLFRDCWKNAYPNDGDDISTSRVLDNTLNVTGLRLLLMGRKGFINFTRNTLLASDHQVFPARTLVVELPPHMVVDEAVVAVCRELKNDGYELALTCLNAEAQVLSLLKYADYVKVDLARASAAQAKRIASRVAASNAQLIGMCIETAFDYVTATDIGCDCVQGRFYCEPQVVDARDIPAAKRNYLTFLQAVQRNPPDYAEIESIVRQEMSLSIKLLRYLNSVAMGMGSRIESIQHALTLLGERPLRRWASLVAITCIGDDKVPELVVTTLIRARLCELISEPAGLGHRSFDLFMAGLLSTLDTMLDRPLDELMIDLPIPVDIKAALLGARSPLGLVIQLVIECERGDSAKIDKAATDLGIAPSRVSEMCQEAIHWAQSVI